jgi:XTP/dITP diphosphohydrolase
MIMMREIIFATNNQHKLQEIKEIVSGRYKILSLADINCFDDIPETSETIAGNAIQKARFIFDRHGLDCFADDTGLEVEALGGAPGVYSARYAGNGCTYEDNVNKLLQELKESSNRRARFVTVIACFTNNNLVTFDGRVDGMIELVPCGKGGFGYDPVFRPEGFEQTFAEMSAETKNSISHRGEAVRKLVDFLMKT